ncbi:transcription factor domain-containing protein [Aspergillus stella-maris]|uniref:transcription factor domain-containing protein n=1 Tax=Aspergillus stella-maris TaxID=1810926 RepID=UPI003CCD4C50
MPLEQRSKQRGKYTTRACEECRRRRAKCDGTRPACSRCLQWQISCQYSTAEDGRRPAPKAYVLQLRQRIDTLERLLERHGIDPQEGKASELAKQQNTEASVDDLTESFGGRLALDEALNFDGDGEMHYFGPMSGRLQFKSSSSTSNPTDPVIGNSPITNPIPPAILNPLDAITVETGFSRSIQDHLLELYFIWENPWFAVVDEELFRRDMATGGRYWSPLLHLSMLATGSRYSHRLDVRSNPHDSNTAGAMFFERAKPYLHKEIEKPSLTTVQALVVIGMFYIAIGADAACWLHHGMANRLSLDMGLNLDPVGFEEMNLLSLREAQLRRQIYWALYCHDKMSSLYTGRICSMLESQGAVKLPDDDEKVSQTSDCTQNTFRSLQRAMIRIAQIQEKILLSLWAPKLRLGPDRRSPFLKSCLLDLKSWLYDLPPDLRIDRSTPNNTPHAYTLHMVYHTTRIILAKPFLPTKKDHLSNVQTATSNMSEIMKLAISVSRESGRAVCLACHKYRAVFGSFQQSPITATHCTLSAALVLLGEFEEEAMVTMTELPDSSPRSPASPATSVGNKLKLCLTVLEELGGSWHTARLIAHNLRRLCFSVTSEESFSVPAAETETDFAQNSTGVLVGGSERITDAFGISDLLPDFLGSSVPAESLPLDYGLFDILNEATWDKMW